MLSDGSRWSLTESKRAHRNNQKPSGKPKLRQLQDMWSMPRHYSNEAQQLISSADDFKYTSLLKPLSERVLNTDEYSICKVCLVLKAMK